MIARRLLLAPLLGLLAPLAAAAPATTDADLALKVRQALTQDLDARLVSEERLAARSRGRSDLDLAREALDTIRLELGTRIGGLIVSAHDGVIELRGSTTDLAAAARAAEIAAGVRGATGVRSTLGGTVELRGNGLDAAEARRAVALAAASRNQNGIRPALDAASDGGEAFSFATDDLLGGRGLRVHVERGRVTMTGTVNGPAARNHVLQKVRSVRGVRSVADRLELYEPPVREEAGTLGILRWRLSNLPELEPIVDDLDLTLRSGVVHVEGAVDSRLHRDLIEVTLLSSRAVLCVISDVQLAGQPEQGAPFVD